MSESTTTAPQGTPQVCERCGWRNGTPMSVYGRDDRECLCSTCYEASPLCTVCGIILPAGQGEGEDDNTYTINDETVCATCYEDYYVCARCGEEEHRDNAYIAWDVPYCEDCFSARFCHCARCGDLLENDQAHSYLDADYCETCYDEISDDDDDAAGIIREYRYKPAWREIYADGDDLRPTVCYGAEYEVETLTGRHRTLEELAYAVHEDIGDLAICKSDGSLSYGVEIVTHPLSWAAWQGTPGTRIIDALRQYRRAYNLTGYRTGNCGQHVHISRSGISDVGLTLMHYLVYLNKPFFHALSHRRGNTGYCRFDADSVGLITDKLSGAASWSRSTALNVTRNTVEMRFPRGTLAVKGIWRNLELARSLVMFCNDEPVIPYNSPPYVYHELARRYYAHVVNHPMEYPYLSKQVTAFEDCLEA